MAAKKKAKAKGKAKKKAKKKQQPSFSLAAASLAAVLREGGRKSPFSFFAPACRGGGVAPGMNC